MTADYSWDDLAGDLPVHQDELMASHDGVPSMAVQDATHGAGLPSVDLGLPDDKYGTGAC